MRQRPSLKCTQLITCNAQTAEHHCRYCRQIMAGATDNVPVRSGKFASPRQWNVAKHFANARYSEAILASQGRTQVVQKRWSDEVNGWCGSVTSREACFGEE